jgi:hypothetical protein
MNLTKVSRNDWVVIAGFIVAFIGTLGPWYTISVAGFGGGSVSGWHGAYLGWLVFILCLVAAVLALSKAVNVNIPLPLPAALIIMVCGALSVLFVVIRLFVVPGAGVGAGIVGVHVGRGWGIWITLIATAAVTLGGFLKNTEPAG